MLRAPPTLFESHVTYVGRPHVHRRHFLIEQLDPRIRPAGGGAPTCGQPVLGERRGAEQPELVDGLAERIDGAEERGGVGGLRLVGAAGGLSSSSVKPGYL